MKGKTTETVLTFYEGIVNKHGQGPGFSLCRKGVDALPAALHAPALIKRVIAGGVCEQEEIADKLLPVVGNNLRTLPVYGIINAKICHCSLFRIRVHLQSRRRQVVRLLTQKGI